MKKLLFALFGALMLCSCSGNIILDEERTFDNNVWNHWKQCRFVQRWSLLKVVQIQIFLKLFNYLLVQISKH